MPDPDLERRVTRLEEWRVYVDRFLSNENRIAIPSAVWWAIGIGAAIGLFIAIGYLAGQA